MNSVERTAREESTIDLASIPDFQVGALRARPASREIIIRGATEMIEPRVMQVLIVLSRRQGEVVSRDQLVATCWGGRVVGDDAINRSIAKVRKLASPNTFELETIPRVGYRLIAASTESAHAETIAPDTEDRRKPVKKPPMSRRRKWILIAGAISLVLILCGIVLTATTMQSLGTSSFSEFIELMSPSDKPNFAVLPFDAVGTDADTNYLADAIPAAINNQLIGLGFQVVSPAIAFQYRGERKARAGTELAPRYVIDGTLRVDGDKLHVTARVDSGSRRTTVWSKDFTAEIRDTGNLPARIATALASLPISTASNRSAEVRSAPNVVAGTMRVNELMRSGDDMSAYLVAKELLREMPGVFAYQTIYCTALGSALDMVPANERANVLADARKIANRAALSTPVGAPYATQALLPIVNWADRERLLREGADARPTYSSFRYALAVLLSNAGRIAEANSFAHESTIMDPLSSSNLLTYASVLDMAGKHDDADVLLNRAERLWPNLEPLELLRFPTALAHRDLKFASAMLNDPELQKTLNPPAEQRPDEITLRALSTRKPADIAQMERECSNPLKQSRRRTAPCLIAFVMLDRIDTFFDLAQKYFPEQRGASESERDARWLENPLAWRNLRLLFRTDTAVLRTDPRIIPIFERMGLLDYWRSTGKWPDFCDKEPRSVCAQMQSRK